MKTKKLSDRGYVGQIAGHDVRFDRHIGWWDVIEDGVGRYRKTHATLTEAKRWFAKNWLWGRLWLIRQVVEKKGKSTWERMKPMWQDAFSLTDATGAQVLADWMQDNDLFHYLKPIIREGNRAGLLWPAGWDVVAKLLKKECSR